MNETGPGRLPVTVIGGYLGAGKTTLVNHVLRNAGGTRIAVLVNEFGELPIDGDLIEAQDDNVISIAGGCVCCSYGNDLVMAMIDLAKMEPAPQHVILEASGVALPGAIAATVGLLQDYLLDGVLVLADAETVHARASDSYMGDTISNQLSDADIIVLNKVDLVSSDGLEDTVKWLADEVPHARIVRATHASLAPEIVFQRLANSRPAASPPPSHQTDTFETFSLKVDAPVDADALAQEMAGSGLIRAKGFALSQDGAMKAIQVVGKRWTVSSAPAGVRPGIVCIGISGRFDGAAFARLVGDDQMRGGSVRRIARGP